MGDLPPTNVESDSLALCIHIIYNNLLILPGRGYYGTYSRDEPPEEVTVETLERLERGERISELEGFVRYTSLEQFADNPRPFNYGLEAGDIVFAVFGSIFLTILVGAIILGYVIHPFFLA